MAVDQLLKIQRPDGGFAEFAHDRESSPVTSAYVVMALARAERAGFSVPRDMLLNVLAYLDVELGRWLMIPGPTLTQDIEAALLLRAQAILTGAPPEGFERLFERRARLPLFARVQLLLAILDDDRSKQREARISMLVTELLANVEETAASARTVSAAGPWVEYWDSSARTNALLLEALLRARPDHPLVFKLVRGLLDARICGRWASSQENAYALLALLEYAAIHEARVPRFDGRVWLGNSTLAQVQVDGDATGFAQDFTPMTELLAASSSDATALILERAGVGRMHYRVGLDWASTDVDRPAVAAGLELRRELRSADGLLGEQQHVALGSLLALDITVEAEHALDDLAIEVPLPGGLEAMQIANYVTSKLGGERGAWVDHLEVHHDRAVMLADHLEPGVYATTVFLRAITAGDYRMPAAQAEMIYYPEIHARTTARRVIID